MKTNKIEEFLLTFAKLVKHRKQIGAFISLICSNKKSMQTLINNFDANGLFEYCLKFST
jgi:hypothetical protein